MEIPTLYEDQDIIALNKPAGLVVHSDGKTEEPTLVEWLLKKYPDISGVGEPLRLSNGKVVDRPGIVHRLDRETSGVILVAKTAEGFACLKAQFHDRKIIKHYHAFVYGQMNDERGMIDRPIGRAKTDFRKWSAERGARGELRDAVTIYKVLKTSPTVSFVEAIPKTGRTHQIRVHLRSISRPVVSDKLYAPGKPEMLGFTRAALHARFS